MLKSLSTSEFFVLTYTARPIPASASTLQYLRGWSSRDLPEWEVLNVLLSSSLMLFPHALPSAFSLQDFVRMGGAGGVHAIKNGAPYVPR